MKFLGWRKTNCDMRGSHSGHCLVCVFCGCPCYDTNIFLILYHWEDEINKEEKENG
jgi:hypothetical protein